jgi:hygromycin-B 7''-O-kinase
MSEDLVKKGDQLQPSDMIEEMETMQGYVRYYTDVSAWKPYVQIVCQRHNLTPVKTVRIGVPGTCPTFMVNERYVVKFFGRLFEGGLTFQAEKELGELAESIALPVPSIIASGRLLEVTQGWHWPYLVFPYVPGVSVGEVYEQVSLDDKLTLARWIGELARSLHRIAAPSSGIFRPAWDTFVDLLNKQRQGCKQAFQEWDCLPEHLYRQVDDFILPVEELVELQATAHLIHADLTADHILGRLVQESWKTLALIDFGDAMVGNLYYELVALHLDLFHCDKRLLKVFLDSYGLDEDERRRLPARAMSMALLHRFNVLGPVFKRYPRLSEVDSLTELAGLLWDINT